MSMKVKPVFVLSRGAGVFIDPSGRMEFVSDKDATSSRINALVDELKTEIGDQAVILEPHLVGDPKDIDELMAAPDPGDALLVYFTGVTPIEALLRWEKPVIAFSGPYTPAMALYAVGEERHLRNDLFVALDYVDIRRMLKALQVRLSLAQSRIVLIGFPAPWHLRWYGFPDLEALRRKLGIQFVPVELRELMEAARSINPEEAAELARKWQDQATGTVEPSEQDLQQSAAACLALDQLLSHKGAHAMAINCLEITQSRKFSGRIANPCMGMSHLRDNGIPTGCEMDIPGLLTMVTLGHLSDKPTFLGNIVRADPHLDQVKISHCILPSRMPGFQEKPLPYTLRDYHGHGGVTAFTQVPAGTRVTVARAQRNLERITAFTGDVVDCQDTSFCRNTLTIQMADARRFVQQAEGNHHVVVFGDYLEDLRTLAGVLDCQFSFMS
jgi:hypothetical protein